MELDKAFQTPTRKIPAVGVQDSRNATFLEAYRLNLGQSLGMVLSYPVARKPAAGALDRAPVRGGPPPKVSFLIDMGSSSNATSKK